MRLEDEIRRLAQQRDFRIQKDLEDAAAENLREQQEKAERLRKEEEKRKITEARENAYASFHRFIYDTIFYPELTELESSLNRTGIPGSNQWGLTEIEGTGSYFAGTTGYGEDEEDVYEKIPYKGYALIRLKKTHTNYEKANVLFFTVQEPHYEHSYDVIFVGDAFGIRIAKCLGVSHDSGPVYVGGEDLKEANRFLMPPTTPETLTADMQRFANPQSEERIELTQRFQDALIHAVQQLPEFSGRT